MNFLRCHRLTLSVVGIMLLAAFLRFYLLRTLPPGLYPDEAVNGNDVTEALAQGVFKVFYSANNGREGLFLFFQGLSLWAFGEHAAWVLRFPSAVIGTATVVGFYYMLTELAEAARVNRPHYIGLVGSFFMATSTWHVVLSRDGFRAILAPCILVYAIYFFLKAIKRNSTHWMLVAGFCMGLGFYSYTAFRPMPLVILACFSLFTQRHYFRSLLAYGAALTVTLVPLVWYFHEHAGLAWLRVAQVSVFSTTDPWGNIANNTILTGKMLLMQGDVNWRHNIAGDPQVFWPVAACMLVGMLVAALRFNVLDRVLGAWLLLAAVPVIVSNQALPHALRSILMLPAVLGFAASGAAWLYERAFKGVSAYRRGIVLVFFGFFITFNAYTAYFLYWAEQPETAVAYTQRYADIAQKINALPEAEAKYVVVNGGNNQLCQADICVQTVMFLTDSFLPERRETKNIHYISQRQYDELPKDVADKAFFLQKTSPTN